MPRGRTEGFWITEAKAEARKGLSESAANHTVAMYVRSQDDLDIGTGVCLRYQRDLFIATAAHLVKRWPSNNIGIIPKAGGNLVTNPAQVVRRAGFEPTIREIVTSRHSLDDLAILHLDARPGGMSDEAFYPVDLTMPPPVPTGMQVLVYGFPSALVKSIRHGAKVIWFNVSPLSDAPKIARAPRDSPIRRVHSYSPALHFLMDFPVIRGAVADPTGMSGAGVWQVEASGSSIWRPRLRLVGIQIAWHKPTRLLIATRIKRLWRILASWEPARHP